MQTDVNLRIMLFVQVNPKTSPLDVCIQEGNKNNVVNINQIQPIQSEIKRSSSSCQANGNTGFTTSSETPDLQPSTDDTNSNPIKPNVEVTTPNTPLPTSQTTASEPEVSTLEITESSNISTESEPGSSDSDDSHS